VNAVVEEGRLTSRGKSCETSWAGLLTFLSHHRRASAVAAFGADTGRRCSQGLKLREVSMRSLVDSLVDSLPFSLLPTISFKVIRHIGLGSCNVDKFQGQEVSAADLAFQPDVLLAL